MNGSFWRQILNQIRHIYCKDHWGNSYYDTKIGKISWRLKQDWIRQLIPVLKKHDIEFTAYYCFEYDSYAPKATSGMARGRKRRNSPGVRLRLKFPGAHWEIPCYETGYRQYILGQLKEIVEGYHPDSLFIDIFGKSLVLLPLLPETVQTKIWL
ncbi:MAG: alpha-L-fucosidase [Lachnospiraceae bacterium]